MKLQFENNLDYQLEAISAIVDIFEGQPYSEGTLGNIDTIGQISIEGASAVGNNLILDDANLLTNVWAIQDKNKLQQSAPGDFIARESFILASQLVPGDMPGLSSRDFTIEMETGTGKTYVYLRTIHELRKKYGWKKFIIVVPSVAIKEGVLKNLEITKEHFTSLYDNQEMNYYVWDPKKRGQARQFATSDTLQIMVITIDSFAKAENIMNKTGDFGTPLDFIKATHPIVIVDEPQNMETEKRKNAIDSLNPLCTLRYSATHKNYYNLMYSLNPVDAYDKGLVKKIEVDSVMSENTYSGAYILLNKIERVGKSKLLANVEIDKDDKYGLQRRIMKLEPGDDLAEITGRSVYDGYILDRIDAKNKSIEFTNGKTFYVGQKDENLQEDIIKYQIERTIENHFEKEARLAEQGIKVLSLFFIDKVANYREYTEAGFSKGKFALWFEQAYEKVRSRPRFNGVLADLDKEKVHDGYFAADKNGVWKDSKDVGGEGARTSADTGAYELIMRDKERLLGMDEPLRFIFSHSALREGWDNPNVFNICTLNETYSEMKKRQEIGRGLRLPVNSDGERIRDDNINILTVVANESYEDFSKKLQTEIESETGASFGGRIKNKENRKRVKLTKRLELDPSFKELWDKIKHKTKYSVEFSNSELIAETVKRLDEVIIRKPKIVNTITKITKMSGGMTSGVRDGGYTKVGENVTVPNILERISNHTYATKEVVFNILDQSGLIGKIMINPELVIDEVSEKVNQSLKHLMVDNIKYEKTGSEWDMRLFENKELETYIYDQTMKSGAINVKNPDKTIYDYIDIDSENEANYLQSLEARDDIKFYLKLPSWFKIDTPLGTYNPDWAVVFDDDERVYFVAETKSTNDLYDGHLGNDERDNIIASREHFKAIDVEFIAPTNSLIDTIEKVRCHNR